MSRLEWDKASFDIYQKLKCYSPYGSIKKFPIDWYQLELFRSMTFLLGCISLYYGISLGPEKNNSSETNLKNAQLFLKNVKILEKILCLVF